MCQNTSNIHICDSAAPTESSATEESNDDVEDIVERESKKQKDGNNINLEDYIQVGKTKGNSGSYALHIATNILNEDEKPYTRFKGG